MPSQRRSKIIGLLVLATVLIVVYITRGAHQTQTSEFYTNTVAAINNRQKAVQAGDAASLAQEVEKLEKLRSLKDEVVAAHSDEMGGKTGTDGKKAPDGALPGADITKEGQLPIAEDLRDSSERAKAAVKDAVHGVDAGEEKSVAGRKMMKDGDKAQKDDGVAKVGNTGTKKTEKEDSVTGADTEEDHEVEIELGMILKKSPIIIFSKSYCPYSMKAKHILLEEYKIVPAPFVVELDKHPLGLGIQNALMTTTGRRTVPNVLINGKSIGGGDDIAALAADDKLVETIFSMGGKRIMEAKKQAPPVEVKFRA